MVEPLTTAVIVSLFVSETIKEGRKALSKDITDIFTFLGKFLIRYDAISHFKTSTSDYLFFLASNGISL
ncbi:hypothetical protein A6770_38030 [Nostoc minutum NIES-26]|uniref:Uncharacterized protein n=1 Tax=Nostoc minutum NIES-26 TaxID=1844469 RepID=A0A367RWA9_9NOSO|nr:hypothetical protein A6770_38030 [Nostoc minutum NIES-26]